MIGRSISQFRILEKLGDGGMGVVYKAEDTRLKRTVALKFLTAHLPADEKAKLRLVREAQVAATLDHPNICTVYQIGDAEGQTFIAMAYVDGRSLKERIDSGPLPPGEARDIAVQIARGLDAAHRGGVVHRDIKPANIMITAEGQVKILDFGLARSAGRSRITRAGTRIGTVDYMSPEQAGGGVVDHRTDIWSLGVVLYEMLTGQLPFGGEGDQAVIHSILHEEPQAISTAAVDVSPEIERVVTKALAKNPDERYQDIGEMLADLGVADGLHRRRGRRKARAGERSARRKAAYLLAGVVGVAVLAILGLRTDFWSAILPLDAKSVAVLPFVAMSPASEEWFIDGVTEDIITQLAKIKDLKVISRTSVMRYKNTEKSLAEIAEELGVATILEGSVRQEDSQVRITAQLIDAKSGVHLWADTFDRELAGIFAVQTDVALGIASALKARLTPIDQKRIEAPQTENLTAYNLYKKGRYFWFQRTPDGMRKGIAYLRQAVEADSTYALAYSGLADCWSCLAYWRYAHPEEAFPKARAAAIRALLLDDDLAEAHVSLGWIHLLHDWDWAAAEREFQRALELSPSYGTAHQWYSGYLICMGRYDEAIAENKRALELDPFSLIIHAQLGEWYTFAGKHDEAREQLFLTLEMDSDFWPAHHFLGANYLYTGQLELAAAEFQKAVDLSSRSPLALGFLGRALARLGERDEAERILDELTARSEESYVSPLDFCEVYVGLGEYEMAYDMADKAAQERDPHVVFFGAAKSSETAVQAKPQHRQRYQAILRRMGLE